MKKIFLFSIVLGIFILQTIIFENIVLAQTTNHPKVIRLEAIKVEGRIQKPQAFYILQRSNLNFEGLEMKKSFLSKIIETIEREPF